MRKVLSVLLCIAILLPCICVGVSAEESDTFYKINIDAGDGAIGEKAIVKDGEIYIPATSFSNYTRFSFDTELKTFLIKGQDFKKAFKYVIIDINKKRVSIRGKKFIDLSDCFEIEGELYLPLCQMLPILNADIYEVKDNVIYISNNKLSLAEVLYDFDISDYYFNISAEFFDDNAMALLTIVPAFVFDSVTNGRFNRLDIIHNSGEYEDYKDAFSEFLADDNLYLKAMAQDASAIDSTVEFFNKANSTAKDMKSVYGWVEAAGKSEISAETGGVLFESLKAYYDSGDLKTDDLKGINDAWTGGKISFGDCIEILSYVYTYATQTEDNRQMLNSVYNVDSKISKKETARKAAKHVYDLYGDNIVPALYKEIATTVASDTLKDLSPIGVYTATAKVAGMVLETFMPFSPGEVAKLPTYSNIALSASSKYRSYDTSTDESTQNLRLSLLLCMIASKKCYEVMDDVFEKDGLSYYEDQIKDIEQLIMALYIVEENTNFDSFEHFEEYRKDNLKKIKTSTLMDALSNMKISQTPETYIAESNELLNKGELKSALMVLYRGIEVLGNSNKISKAIDDYFKRVTVVPTAYPGVCEEKYCFQDTSYTQNEEYTEGDIGLMLVDTKSGIKQTVMRLTLKYDDGYYPPGDDDATIIGNSGDTWLFYTFSGAGKSSAFLYTIHTNKLVVLESGTPVWDISNDILIGQSLAYGVGDPTSLYAYNWNGDLLYSKEELCGQSILVDGWIYFITYDISDESCMYEVHRMKSSGTDIQKLCYIKIPSQDYSYLWLDDTTNEVVWEGKDIDGRMKLSKLKNIDLTNQNKNQDIAPSENASMIITLEWHETDAELELSVELYDGNSAKWIDDNLYNSDGLIIATREETERKQIVNIFDINQKYLVRVDDLNYGAHGINYVSSANLNIRKDNKIIVDDIGVYMNRANTGYWSASLTINCGEIIE